MMKVKIIYRVDKKILFTENHLKKRVYNDLIDGKIGVYDIGMKDISLASIHTRKYTGLIERCGFCVVFSFGGRNKLIIYNK